MRKPETRDPPSQDSQDYIEQAVQAKQLHQVFCSLTDFHGATQVAAIAAPTERMELPTGHPMCGGQAVCMTSNKEHEVGYDLVY